MGCTLAQYSEAKRLPLEFLRGLGLSDRVSHGRPAIRIPYRNEHGDEIAVRYRTALAKSDQGDQRFRWKQGAKPCLYGLWWLEQSRAAGSVVVVEGESDAQTVWLHGIRALGLPGAALWQEAWVQHFEGIATIYVVVEPDAGVQAVLVGRFDRFARSVKHLITALEAFRSLNLNFISLQEQFDTSRPIGQALFMIIGVMAPLERDSIRERVKAGLDRARKRGVPLGRPAAQANPDEMAALRPQGLSWPDIAKRPRCRRSTVNRRLREALLSSAEVAPSL